MRRGDRPGAPVVTAVEKFWALPAATVLEELKTGGGGLTEAQARQRLARFGRNVLKNAKKTDALTLLLAQFKSPLVIILVLAALLSFFLGETVDAWIIVAIVGLSGLLGFRQEKRAADAVKRLLAMVQISVRVRREGREFEIPIEDVAPGDLVILNAGDVIPGDCLLLESKDLFVDEAALTGESFPAEKRAGAVDAEAPLARRTNTLFMGTHVISGDAEAVVVRTGVETEFGRVSERLRLKPAETEFERGIRRFGYLITQITFVLVVAIFGFSVVLARPPLESFLFALALAVGIIPELLPAIIGINLAVGAERMARRRVIVKHLPSIENFGQMDVLCSDKTGTLTEGVVKLHAALDAEGRASEKALLYAYLNASYETGFTNPIDEAIRNHRSFDLSAYHKLDEVPYDFVRKRLSILIEQGGRKLMITKGALSNVLEVCTAVDAGGQSKAGLADMRGTIESRFQELSEQGFRVLGLAWREGEFDSRMTKADECEMTFLGFLAFDDPPREGLLETIGQLKEMGIGLKVISGDNRLVAAHVARQVFGFEPRVLTGTALHQLSDEALRQRVSDVDVFAEVEPNQKERIILALRKAGHVVGYLGDGINDASALHTADVGISVNNAVDVAKEAAAIVLLEKDLHVLLGGVREGRTTFANTLKYILMTTSANFGNMFSMAVAALFLPFLPLLPKQILLNNFLSDFPAMAIATDRVDRELVERPQRWDIRFIRNFMIVFGAISSVFDFMTFGLLLFALQASAAQFQTGWFLVSVVTELLIVPVIRTRRPFYQSRMGRPLLVSTGVVLAASVTLPYLPPGQWLGFTPLPPPFLLAFAAITALYLLVSEAAKHVFYRKFGASSGVERRATDSTQKSRESKNINQGKDLDPLTP
jgi:Mg2+-importing ATPase